MELGVLVQNPFEEEYYVFEFEASVQRGTRIGWSSGEQAA